MVQIQKGAACPKRSSSKPPIRWSKAHDLPGGEHALGHGAGGDVVDHQLVQTAVPCDEKKKEHVAMGCRTFGSQNGVDEDPLATILIHMFLRVASMSIPSKDPAF